MVVRDKSKLGTQRDLGASSASNENALRKCMARIDTTHLHVEPAVLHQENVV